MLRVQPDIWNILVTPLFFGSGINSACAAQPETPESSAAASDKSNLICVREHQTGTHFKRRVCRTKEEMEKMERETREMLDSLPPGQTMGGAPQ